MIITITDERDEVRNRAVQRDIDGTILPGTSSAERQAFHRIYNNTATDDKRVVTVRIEDTDYAAAGIPEWLDISGSRQVDSFFVQVVDIAFRRSGRDDSSPEWSQSVTVRGDNRKRDGQPGLKPQNVGFPTASLVQVGTWTEADIDPNIDPESWSGKHQRQRVGEARMERTRDPMPGWLQKIIDRVHPETGELPFRWTPTHLFGDFVEHTWNPEVGIELQEATR